MRNNVFVDCGYALDGSAQTDARFNYWGDASGPYHETDNPSGLGDTITGGVQFIPWLTDTTEGAESARGVLPHEFSVSAIPNPFNSSTRLRFTLPVTSEIRIAVFDLLGRAVKEVADQRFVAGTHQVTIDASNFSSGIYFARVQSEAFSATTRLVLVK
ncbi:T9SS type A sorting domain-containing protein [bacterium]|nr:T9SS type A sorting domain-containing protein [bacterium]